jgi:hypothetical protein
LAGAIEFYSSGFHGGEDVSINNAVLLDSDIDILSLNIVRCNPEGFAAPGWNSFPNSSLPAQVLDPERDSAARPPRNLGLLSCPSCASPQIDG